MRGERRSARGWVFVTRGDYERYVAMSQYTHEPWIGMTWYWTQQRARWLQQQLDGEEE